MQLILLRHGESQWNLENRFTGWKDVSLSKTGVYEASTAAEKLIENNIEVSTIQTSLLKRAIDTAKIVADLIEFPIKNIKYDWRLNERNYGALQGLNKSETASKFGEEQVKIWRRSFDIAPPLLDKDDKRHPRFNPKFKDIGFNLPRGESLKDVILRLNPFWKKYFKAIKQAKGNHLIVAHSNSLRAIIKILDNLSKDEIISVNIPTGVPLVYNFDNNFNIISKQYLIDESDLQKKLELVKNQGKVK
mgnify:CR=1 FL=1